MNPEVSVVIPCYNEAHYIGDCIHSLLTNGTDPSHMELLVVDGGSTDGTVELLKELSQRHLQVKVLNNPDRITPRALNIGVQAAQGTYILISSAHSSFDYGYIGTLISTMSQHADAIAVGGVMETKVKNSTAMSESIRTVLMHPVGVGNAKFRTGVSDIMTVDTVPFGLYRAQELKAVGGYDERLIRNHDMELSKRLLRKGGKIYLTPEAKCTYYARETFRAMAKNNFNNGQWNLKTVYITRTFSSLSLRHFIPMLFLGAWTLPLLLSLITCNPWWSLASFGVLIAYTGVLTAVSWRARNGKNKVLMVLIAFKLLHFSYGLGSLIGLLSLPFTSRKI
ncbi:MAG: glycosyltransferase family 2 protein [Flavobacteriales bacterium]